MNERMNECCGEHWVFSSITTDLYLRGENPLASDTKQNILSVGVSSSSSSPPLLPLPAAVLTNLIYGISRETQKNGKLEEKLRFAFLFSSLAAAVSALLGKSCTLCTYYSTY